MSWTDIPNVQYEEIKALISKIYIEHIVSGGNHEDIVCAIYSAINTGIYVGQIEAALK